MKKIIQVSIVIILISISLIAAIYFYVENKNVEIAECKNLPEYEYRGELGSYYIGAECFSDLAVKYNSPEICEELSDKRALKMCYKVTAVGLSRSDLCYKIIADPEQKITCLAAITLDPKVCKQACDFVLELEGFTDCSISLTDTLEEMCYMTIKNFKRF